MPGDYSGQLLVLKDAVNSSLDQIDSMVAEIKAAADAVRWMTQEISQGNKDMSDRASEQASSLEQTQALLGVLTESVTQNAERSNNANRLAATAEHIAETGGAAVKDAIDAMRAIKTSSEKIGTIISVINEIAFQTNILALNASVEAARAGVHGRGFAVVANEVRNLAQRSALASKEIKDLIDDSMSKVDAGANLVNNSGQMLNEIFASVHRVREIIDAIAAENNAQKTGLSRIQAASAQLDDITQQNAALSEETAAASENLNEQANKMVQLVNYFSDSENSPQQKYGG